MIEEGNPVSYRVQEFAELAGVTVRALHHYDRLGLLRARRSESGYRLYSLRDLERLEQIVALQFLGLPLKQIRELMDRGGVALPDALRMQRTVLEQRRRLLDRAIAAIGEAEKAAHAGNQPDAALLKKIIEVLEMQNNTDWTAKYYSPEAKAKVEAGKQRWSPELQERVSRQWTELIADVETALGEDPNSPRVQALADRWTALVEEFTGGDPGVTEGVKNVWNDRANWPADAKEQSKSFYNPPVWKFMMGVLAARKK